VTADASLGDEDRQLRATFEVVIFLHLISTRPTALRR